MSAPASTRFTVTVKGLPRILLSVREQNSGRLIVTVQGTGNAIRELGNISGNPSTFAQHNVRIAQQKFSIHPSSRSDTHNQLHFHQILADGTKKDNYHVTSAITSNKFAPLFIKRYSALRDSCYDLKKGTNIVNLGVYDNSKFNLIAGVLVGHRESNFDEKRYDFSCLQHRFRDFRLIVLLSYFLMPATDTSMITTVKTLRPEEAVDDADRKFREGLMVGGDARQCVQFFQNNRNLLRDEGLMVAARLTPNASASDPMVEVAQSRYFRSGEYTNKVIKAVRARFPKGL